MDTDDNIEVTETQSRRLQRATLLAREQLQAATSLAEEINKTRHPEPMLIAAIAISHGMLALTRNPDTARGVAERLPGVARPRSRRSCAGHRR